MLKKTLKKYFVSPDGTVSWAALMMVITTLLIAAGKVMNMMPIDGNDLIALGTILGGGGSIVGIYRRIGGK